jgi:hypothetical protein
MDTGNGNDSISGTNSDYAADYTAWAFTILKTLPLVMATTILVVLATSMASPTAVSLILIMAQTTSLVVDGWDMASPTAVSLILGNDADNIFGSAVYGGISNSGISNTGNVQTSWGPRETFYNTGNVFLGEGNDSLSASGSGDSITNSNFIGTGDGNDIITGIGVIYNDGVIETGNGDDSILVYGIFNNSGAINMGDGNDVIRDFDSDPNSSGAWFLGEGDDYIQLGSANGDFYGGSGNDTLQLPFGTYTVGIGGEVGESLIFTSGDRLMITSEFETLKVGSTIYDFTSLTAGQIIVA